MNKKYILEDAGTQKYVIGNFRNFQMTEDRDVWEILWFVSLEIWAIHESSRESFMKFMRDSLELSWISRQGAWPICANPFVQLVV